MLRYRTFIVIIILIILLAIITKNNELNNEFRPSNDVIEEKYKDMKFMLFRLGDSSPGYENLDSAFLINNNNSNKYEKAKNSAFLTYQTDFVNNRTYLLGHYDCNIKIYGLDMSFKQVDLCDIKGHDEINGGINTNLIITNDRIIAVINGGYTKTAYAQTIRIMDKDFNVIKDIPITKIILSYALIEDRFYYIVGHDSNESDMPMEWPDKIMLYNLTSQKESVFYENKNRDVLDNLFTQNKELYISYHPADGGYQVPFKFGVFENNNLINIPIKNNIRKRSVFESINRDDGLYIRVFETPEHGPDDVVPNKGGYIRVNNRKVEEHYALCDENMLEFTKNNMYCVLEKDATITRIKFNEDKATTIKVNLPEQLLYYRFAFYD